ncbi:hypothetical protein [Silvanigrella sp.]|jgi:hypothetical protein
MKEGKWEAVEEEKVAPISELKNISKSLVILCSHLIKIFQF